MAENKPHKAKPSRKNRKHGRNLVKCARYRARVGKPRGRGVAGQKSHGRGRDAALPDVLSSSSSRNASSPIGQGRPSSVTR